MRTECWAAQDMRLPVWWYVNIQAGIDEGFEVSGDATTLSARRTRLMDAALGGKKVGRCIVLS